MGSLKRSKCIKFERTPDLSVDPRALAVALSHSFLLILPGQPSQWIYRPWLRRYLLRAPKPKLNSWDPSCNDTQGHAAAILKHHNAMVWETTMQNTQPSKPSTRRMTTPMQHPLSYPKKKQAWRYTRNGSLSQINLDLSYSEQLYWYCKSTINRHVDSLNSILCMVGYNSVTLIKTGWGACQNGSSSQINLGPVF